MPKRQPAANYPGHVTMGALGKCCGCYSRAARHGRNTPPEPTTPTDKRFLGPCPRCGVPSTERRHPICTDCRDVLTTTEAQVWAA
ncbi:hypothetical protein [Agreia sp. COWG]|uniref:hypothetical protein n=1 Tax=Agreia sp. COWG TaxID=2773266 RepID=UPI00192939E8|nr:hypothetical protein [Agreia sp. COWG]